MRQQQKHIVKRIMFLKINAQRKENWDVVTIEEEWRNPNHYSNVERCENRFQTQHSNLRFCIIIIRTLQSGKFGRLNSKGN